MLRRTQVALSSASKMPFILIRPRQIFGRFVDEFGPRELIMWIKQVFKQDTLNAANTNSRCSRPMCGVAAGLSRPSKHLIRLAFTMRPSPHNVGHHESRFPSLGISAMNGHRGQMG